MSECRFGPAVKNSERYKTRLLFRERIAIAWWRSSVQWLAKLNAFQHRHLIRANIKRRISSRNCAALRDQPAEGQRLLGLIRQRSFIYFRAKDFERNLQALK